MNHAYSCPKHRLSSALGIGPGACYAQRSEYAANIALAASAKPRIRYCLRRTADGRIVGEGFATFGEAYDACTDRRASGEVCTIEQGV